jgi:hypothetical protein
VQEVIGTDLEAFNLVQFTVLGRQHQQRRVHSRVAQVQTDAEAISLGQHEVQHDHVVGAGQASQESGFAIVALFYQESFVAQQIRHSPREIVVVFDNEHSAAFITHFK